MEKILHHKITNNHITVLGNEIQDYGLGCIRVSNAPFERG